MAGSRGRFATAAPAMPARPRMEGRVNGGDEQMVDLRLREHTRRIRLVPLVVLALLAGCATAPGDMASRSPSPAVATGDLANAAPAARSEREPEIARPAVELEVGEASWYGAAYAGRPTASGEPFDPEALTAAHPALPFGTEVTVVNLDNGRHVDVVINDRGPFIADRIIDLSEAAARVLGFLRAGLAQVRILAAGSPESA